MTIVHLSETMVMKTMLLTAAILGTAIAGIILYAEERKKARNRIKSTTDNSNDYVGSLERPMQFAMG